MTDFDDLLTKADTLLARWRSGTVVPGPPADYPVLTDVIKAPSTRADVPLPEIPLEPGMPVIDSSAAAAAADTAGLMEVPVLDSSLEVPAFDAPSVPETGNTVLAALETTEGLPNLPSIEDTPSPGDAATHALEERVRLRVIEAIEPHVGAFLEEPLRLRIEELARQLATKIAGEARQDILTLVRDAVRSAVELELASQRDERSRER